jgi:hypothetical protein
MVIQVQIDDKHIRYFPGVGILAVSNDRDIFDPAFEPTASRHNVEFITYQGRALPVFSGIIGGFTKSEIQAKLYEAIRKEMLEC